MQEKIQIDRNIVLQNGEILEIPISAFAFQGYMGHFLLEQNFIMIRMILITIFVIVLTVLYSTICVADPCRFEHPEKGVIDITTLGRTDGNAAYADRIPSTTPYFSILTLFLHTD